MPTLYLYDNGPSAARVLQRPALRALRDAGFGLVVGCNADDGYLFADLLGPGVSLLPGPLPAGPRGALLDLGAGCPGACLPVDLSLRRYRDTQAPQWWSVATLVNRQLADHGLDPTLEPLAETPMLDFHAECAAPAFARPTIYVDTRLDREAMTHFVFDWPRLLALLPDHDFWCAGGVPFAAAQLRDGSGADLVQQALVSERCVMLLGRTWNPFAITLTTANRDKPKAVCGHDRHLYQPFWDYAGNPLEYLATMEQLADFLRSNATARRLAPALV